MSVAKLAERLFNIAAGVTWLLCWVVAFKRDFAGSLTIAAGICAAVAIYLLYRWYLRAARP